MTKIRRTKWRRTGSDWFLETWIEDTDAPPPPPPKILIIPLADRIRSIDLCHQTPGHRMISRFPGRCEACAANIPAGSSVKWNRAYRTIMHGNRQDCIAQATADHAAELADPARYITKEAYRANLQHEADA